MVGIVCVVCDPRSLVEGAGADEPVSDTDEEAVGNMGLCADPEGAEGSTDDPDSSPDGAASGLACRLWGVKSANATRVSQLSACWSLERLSRAAGCER